MAQWEAWWLNGSVPDCCPPVPGSNPVSPQPTADCQSPGGLQPGMALGCELTSVRKKKLRKMSCWFAKKICKKKNIIPTSLCLALAYLIHDPYILI